MKDEGIEVTNGLYTEIEFVVAVHSFYTGNPSAEFIQALEDTEVYYILKDELDAIYVDCPEFRENTPVDIRSSEPRPHSSVKYILSPFPFFLFTIFISLGFGM